MNLPAMTGDGHGFSEGYPRKLPDGTVIWTSPTGRVYRRFQAVRPQLLGAQCVAISARRFSTYLPQWVCAGRLNITL